MKIRKFIDKVLESFLVIIMGGLVLDVLWQVISRYLLKSPSSFTDELARFLLIWVGILGAAYAAGKKMHLAIDIIVSKFNKKNRIIIYNLINFVITLFAFFVMVIGGSNLMYILLKLGNTSPALSIPIGYIYSVIPLSGILIIYYSIYDIVATVREKDKINPKNKKD
jgi:TRAP-type C4-dicarboxylate transport system permease small subunit